MGAVDEESAARTMDEESAEGQRVKEILIVGSGWSETPMGNNGSMFPEGADRILAMGV